MLNKYTIEELEAEIEKRKAEAQRALIPQPLESSKIDIRELIKLAVEIRDQELAGVENDDNEHWCYEEVMKAVFGKDYWDRMRLVKTK